MILTILLLDNLLNEFCNFEWSDSQESENFSELAHEADATLPCGQRMRMGRDETDNEISTPKIYCAD